MNVDNLKSILQEILNSDVANIKLYATTNVGGNPAKIIKQL